MDLVFGKKIQAHQRKGILGKTERGCRKVCRNVLSEMDMGRNGKGRRYLCMGQRFCFHKPRARSLKQEHPSRFQGIHSWRYPEIRYG